MHYIITLFLKAPEYANGNAFNMERIKFLIIKANKITWTYFFSCMQLPWKFSFHEWESPVKWLIYLLYEEFWFYTDIPTEACTKYKMWNVKFEIWMRFHIKQRHTNISSINLNFSLFHSDSKPHELLHRYHYSINKILNKRR